MKVAMMAYPNLTQTLIGLSALASLVNAAPAYSEERISPPVGETAKATVGTKIWELYSFVGVEGVIIDAPINARWGSAEEVNLPAGAGLFIIRDRKLKACREQVTYSNLPGPLSIWTDCLVDSEDDGRFDKVIYNADGFSKRVEPPVPYKRGIVEVAGEGESNFRKVIIYSGAGDGIIKFSYREFTNDMARPAYTEELTLPLGKSFPQDIAIKDHVFTLLSLDGMGLAYQRLR
jgi:hypothetical protein